jgi:hypothetical protein
MSTTWRGAKRGVWRGATRGNNSGWQKNNHGAWKSKKDEEKKKPAYTPLNNPVS